MEVLLRVVDKSPDPMSFKAGDVIAVKPDGWAWSAHELTNPEWRIVSVDILNTTTEALLQHGPLHGNGKQPTRKREWFFDITKMPNTELFTGARTQAVITITRQQAMSCVKKKA